MIVKQLFNDDLIKDWSVGNDLFEQVMDKEFKDWRELDTFFKQLYIDHENEILFQDLFFIDKDLINKSEKTPEILKTVLFIQKYGLERFLI